MAEWLGLLPAFPLAGFLALVLTGGRLPRRIAGVIGVGSVALSFLLALIVASSYLAGSPEPVTFTLWTWMSAGEFAPGISFYLDGLSVVMILIITGVGFLIHLYSTGFMAEDPGFARFFSYMNLFVASMLILVLADNLVLLYLGWEGVGLCSYLLIGFWYDNPANGAAARKAFVVTRVGDTSMAIGLFLLFRELGTLDIQQLLAAASGQWEIGSGVAVAAAALLLGGAVGKSAQLPLQTWLPDAMAGPTPISALIHAATMVTAGVYLIARTHVLFELAPSVQLLVAVIGLLTLLMAGFTALMQRDIKRILAYSTISQIGYMFLALGVGAWSAAIFHLMTHAFFKALLFLAAGTVILSLHHEHDIFRMGGMRKRLPLAFWSFVIGSAALTALPFTSGFYSKDEILLAALAQPDYGMLLWLGGVLGAFLTALYSFRLVFVAFFGPMHFTQGADDPHHGPVREIAGISMALPLVVLALLSLVGGFIPVPVEAVFASASQHAEAHPSLLLHGIMIAIPIAGVLLSWFLYGERAQGAGSLRQRMATLPGAGFLQRLWFNGWYMDALYNALLVRPFVAIARLNRHDLIDQGVTFSSFLAQVGNRLLVLTQTGNLRWYGVSMVAGLVAVLAIGAWI